eukprot:TRINITY_DN5509_c0_g1_i1.p1 TRINITY_DN5509_c0_g1~~TRINITY_DN5509_c0_g1_i1.p1  ORF type:complete len:1061 (+),score=378.03 TRINITY_DN5509_c0_g1_i1:75-3257(+)
MWWRVCAALGAAAAAAAAGEERWGVTLPEREGPAARRAAYDRVLAGDAEGAVLRMQPCIGSSECRSDVFVVEVAGASPAARRMAAVAQGGAEALAELGVRSVFRDRVIARRQLQEVDYEGGDHDEEAAPRRRPLGRAPGAVDVVATLKIEQSFWGRGIRGEGVKVAIFDTGIAQDHPAFARNAQIKMCVDYTGAPSCEDGLGHGSFVAGLIASQDEACVGMAGGADVYVFKVFTDKQVSYTSWFLEAFNHAIDLGVDVLNLSVGGPDYMDTPFMEKVTEAAANGITIVSAIGNSGPLFGTLNNPADMLSVIGVGAAKQDKRVASFSSRGMTTWELPEGYGRVKPDVLTYGDGLWSTAHTGGCKALSGTSVAAPVVAGVCTDLTSLARKHGKPTNPAFLKQALLASARPLRDASVYEQGAGLVSAVKAAEFVASAAPPSPSIFPSDLALHDCARWWPHCKHPLFPTSMPVTVNLTVLNPVSLRGHITHTEFKVTAPDLPGIERVLDVGVEYSDVLWPWVGWLAVTLSAREGAEGVHGGGGARLSRFNDDNFGDVVDDDVGSHQHPVPSYKGVLSGVLEVFIRAESGEMFAATATLAVEVIPTPPPQRRLLWDVFHSMMYPPAYVARDDLHATRDVLDWNGDHPHTNFKDTFDFLVEKGYHVDLLTADFTHFNAAHYAALLLFDAEEEYSDAEAAKLQRDIRGGLAAVVFADWYNQWLMEKAVFLDDNTGETWSPLMGGANLPALNALLAPFDVAFASDVYSGNARWGALEAEVKSGAALKKFPKGGYVFASETPMVDVAATRREAEKQKRHRRSRHAGAPPVEVAGVPLLGVTDPATGVKIAAFGDTDCLDTAHMPHGGFCHLLLEQLLVYAVEGRVPDALLTSASAAKHREDAEGVWVDAAAGDPEGSRVAAAHSHALHGAKDRRTGEHHPIAVVAHRKADSAASGVRVVKEARPAGKAPPPLRGGQQQAHDHDEVVLVDGSRRAAPVPSYLPQFLAMLLLAVAGMGVVRRRQKPRASAWSGLTTPHDSERGTPAEPQLLASPRAARRLGSRLSLHQAGI